MRDVLIVAPTTKPVTLSLLKKHLRLSHDDLDDVINLYLDVVISLIQGKTGRQLLTATREVITDETTDEILLFREPFIEVVSVKDRNGSTLSYEVFDNEKPVRVEIASTEAPVYVRYKCGYASASDIPADIIGALMLLVGRLYENPQDPVDRHLSFAEKIIKKYRVRSWQG